jgi:hypothetical protein
MVRAIVIGFLATCCVAPTLGAPAVAPPRVVAGRSYDDDLAVVKATIAKVMRIKPEAVEPKLTLSDLKVTNLDLADIREMLETKLKIQLRPAALKMAAGTEDPYAVVDKLTVSRFAAVVNAAPRAK